MKISLSRNQKFSITAIIAALVLGGVIASLPTGDPILREVEKFRSDASSAEDSEETKRFKRLMKRIRTEGANVNVADEEGYTPLMNAVRYGTIDDVRYLLVRKASLKRRGPQGKTALDLAEDKRIRSLLQYCELAEKKLSHQEKEEIKAQFRQIDIDPDKLDQLIFKAIRYWRGDTTRFVASAIALGAGLNQLNEEGEHVLERDIWKDDIITLLLRNGADPDTVLDKHGASRILSHHINGKPGIVQQFMAVKPSVKGPHIIAAAAGTGNAEMVRCLLDMGADPTGMTDEGWSVLECAVRGYYHGESRNTSDFGATVRMLIDAGAPTEITTADGSVRSPLSPGAMSIRPDSIRALVDAGADVNALNNRGANYAQIAVYKSASQENLELLEDIISKGADLSHVDSRKESFLIYALRTLCDINVKADDEEEREEAEDLLEEYFDIVEDSDPDPALLDKNGNTALHLAAIKYGPSVGRTIEFLLKLGVDPEVRNKFGRTALDVLLRDHSEREYADAFKILAPVSPEPKDEADRLKLAVLTNNLEEVEDMVGNVTEKHRLTQMTEYATSMEVMELLLDAGADIYYSACRFIASHGTPEIVDVLSDCKKLERMSNCWEYVKSTELAAALLDAGLKPPSFEQIKSDEILKFLMEKDLVSVNSAPLNPTSYRDSRLPLPRAASDDNPKLVMALLEGGAPVNGYPESPLALTDSPEVAEMLIAHGADTDWKNSRGEDLLTLRRNKLTRYADIYSRHKDKDDLKRFSDCLSIYKLLQSECDIDAPHPRREEIKKALQQRRCKEEYETVIFEVDGWRGRVRLNREAMVYARCMDSTDAGNILSWTPTHLEIKWDRWGHGFLERGEDNVYRHAKNNPRYDAFKAEPTLQPHYTAPFVNEKNENHTLYFSSDTQCVVRSDTGEGAMVSDFFRNYQKSSFKWRNQQGQTTTFFWLNGAFRMLNADTAKLMLRTYKPDIAFKEERLVGHSWDDKVRISQEFMVAARASRSQDTAVVSEYTQERIILKWDRWGVEIFYRHPDGAYYSTAKKLLPEHSEIRNKLIRGDKSIRFRTLHLVHPIWSAPVRCSFKHKIAAKANDTKGTAVILDFSRNHITLKWDNFGVERYERHPDGKFHKK